MLRPTTLRRALLLTAASLPRTARHTLAPSWRSFSAASANPLVACVQERSLPPFEQLQISHITPAVKDAAADYTRDLHALETKIQALLPEVKWTDVVHPLELQSDPLERMWGVVGHLMSVRNSDDLRHVHDELQQLVIQTFTEASQSKTLYDAYQAIRNSSEWASLSLAQQVRPDT
jgi:oligopeptidase A